MKNYYEFQDYLNNTLQFSPHT